ncbi:MAG TPA: hypothetical protein VLA45_20605, partial [Paracoccaceae bacterium]|nr:hypothetical protein [Paracoccaceae bacterium]
MARNAPQSDQTRHRALAQSGFGRHSWAMFTPQTQNRPLAVALMLTATAFIAATTLLAKAIGTGTLGAPLPALQISHGRFVFAFLAIGSMALLFRPHLQRP